MNKQFIYFICLVSALGGLLFGYDWVVIGGAERFYELYFGIENSASMQGLAMSIALVGCLVGAMLMGALADKYGRKRLLALSALVFLISSIWTGSMHNFAWFLVARFMGGIGIGIASGLSPMYIAEVAPTKVRGQLVALNQMTIVLGILGAQIANWLIADDVASGTTNAEMLESWNCQMGWRWMFWACAFPAAVFSVLVFFIPESPRWMASVGREKEAHAVLAKLGGDGYADSELNAIKAQLAAASKDAQDAGGLKELFQKRYRMVLILGVVIAFFQQWCGTNVIFNYATKIFEAAGYEIGDVLFNIVVTGVANVVFTVVALFVVDRLGRRPLMLLGAGGLGIIYAILGTCYYLNVSGIGMIVLVVLAIGCYALTLGPCTWVLISEIFPTRLRGIGMAVSTFMLWVGSSTLTYFFPMMNESIGAHGAFWTYTGVCAAGFLFFFFKLPETKGVSLEELEKKLIK